MESTYLQLSREKDFVDRLEQSRANAHMQFHSSINQLPGDLIEIDDCLNLRVAHLAFSRFGVRTMHAREGGGCAGAVPWRDAPRVRATCALLVYYHACRKCLSAAPVSGGRLSS